MILLDFLAQMCHYAQEHIDGIEAWDILRADALMCTSYAVACFLAHNTLLGEDGVEWDIVFEELVAYPAKAIEEWLDIINTKANLLGGWSTPVVPPAAPKE